MRCEVCNEFLTRAFICDGKPYCSNCKNGRCRCKQCRNYFKPKVNGKSEGIYIASLGRKGWHCWDCLFSPVEENKEDENWIGYTAGSYKDKETWQVCTVIFEEVFD
jgi:hypothetical protein